MAEKEPDTAMGRRQSKWPKGSKKHGVASNSLLLRQIEATERLADAMAEANLLKRLELDRSGDVPKNMILPAERERSMAEVLASIDYSLLENEDG